MYVLDTNVIIYYLKNDSVVVQRLKELLASSRPCVSAITEVELLSFPLLSPTDEIQIEQILSTTSLVSVDSQIAKQAGALRRKHGLKLADSVIAATALFTGKTLITRNARDFKRVPTLTVERI